VRREIWKESLVAVVKVERELDPRLLMDIALTRYRDAIDRLRYMLSSMIDRVGTAHHLGGGSSWPRELSR
jgi:hypothetical protein